jgi:GT2 family glycosyltransferase
MYVVTGSIVLYNNDPEIIKGAMFSFLNTKLSLKLFVIDNSPSDQLREIFEYPNVEYLHNPLNPGFGASHNLAILKSIQSNSNYHVILNPDIYFDSGTIETIVDFMDMNFNIGLLMPMINYPNGELQYLCKKNPTFFNLFVRGFVPKIFSSIINSNNKLYEYRDHNYQNLIYDIPYLSGCFMFFRTDILQKTGLFDERFFMYLEDADITRRVLEISRTVYYPFAKVYHHFAGFTHKKIKFKLITIKSAFTYFNKWGWFK